MLEKSDGFDESKLSSFAKSNADSKDSRASDIAKREMRHSCRHSSLPKGVVYRMARWKLRIRLCRLRDEKRRKRGPTRGLGDENTKTGRSKSRILKSILANEAIPSKTSMTLSRSISMLRTYVAPNLTLERCPMAPWHASIRRKACKHAGPTPLQTNPE